MALPKGFIPWNKGKRIAPLRACEGCGRSNRRIFKARHFGIIVCDKHYQHLKTHGRLLSDTEAKTRLRTSQSRWIGKRAWNYKGGRASLNMVVRRCARYKQWVRDVFHRDDFTCQKCFVRGAYLEADHFPIRFSTIMDEERITTYESAMACLRLWDTSNGRTLCRKCHRSIKL